VGWWGGVLLCVCGGVVCLGWGCGGVWCGCWGGGGGVGFGGLLGCWGGLVFFGFVRGGVWCGFFCGELGRKHGVSKQRGPLKWAKGGAKGRAWHNGKHRSHGLKVSKKRPKSRREGRRVARRPAQWELLEKGEYKSRKTLVREREAVPAKASENKRRRKELGRNKRGKARSGQAKAPLGRTEENSNGAPQYDLKIRSQKDSETKAGVFGTIGRKRGRAT